MQKMFLRDSNGNENGGNKCQNEELSIFGFTSSRHKQDSYV